MRTSKASALQKIELLAPAKDLECGKVAIRYGADAVYIGAPKFSARAAAGNSIKDIESLARFAHQYWARVYVALNTILFDAEVDEAGRMIHSLFDAGADALIIQDMGILELDIPPIPLFASTQVHNISVEKIQFLENVGFQRVILARELSLRQIKEIRKATTIELESFIHGALCVSYSGRCFMSEAVQGRSANRGMCAQMCRMPYTLTDSNGTVREKEKHLLSLKDLHLSEYLNDLLDSGVSSFKIEGRLKDLNYVKNVTAFYRKQIDELLKKNTAFSRASSGRVRMAFDPDPFKTFNRGFTDYVIHHRKKDILSPNTPKSIGHYLGTVKDVQRNSFILHEKSDVHNGDGICFFDTSMVLQGTNINTVKELKIVPDEMKGIQPGLRIYRNYDYAFSKILQADKTTRTIDITILFEETENGFRLTLKDFDESSISVERIMEKISAQKPREASESIRHQLLKLGGSIYSSEEVLFQWTRPYFIPVKKVNEMRREAISHLTAERIKKYPRKNSARRKNAIPYPIEHLDYSENVANEKAKLFYASHGVKTMTSAFEIHPVNDAVLMTTKHCLRFHCGICTGQQMENAESLYLHDRKRRYRLIFDCRVCQMKIILDPGVKRQ